MRPKTKVIIFILISFILGIFCGIFIKNYPFWKFPHQAGKGPANFTELLTEKLTLSGEQAALVDTILSRNMKYMESFKKQALAMRDSTREQIRKILNNDQKKLFDQFNSEMDKRGERRSERK
jgi:hypothetical protein